MDALEMSTTDELLDELHRRNETFVFTRIKNDKGDRVWEVTHSAQAPDGLNTLLRLAKHSLNVLRGMRQEEIDCEKGASDGLHTDGNS